MTKSRLTFALAVGALLAISACSPEASEDALLFEPIVAENPVPASDTYVRVCKLAYNVNVGLPDDGTFGEWFDFETTATGGTVLLPETSAQALTLATYNPDVDCKTVWTNPGVSLDDQTQVTVTEVAKPGFEIQYAYYSYPSKIIVGPQDAILPGDETNSATVVPLDGVYLYFKNVKVDDPPPPPPPATGGEGCTPGYWKQPHHFDSWVGYTPEDSYSAVFGVGPEISLLDGLELKGGKFNALVRHSVAALLGASSPDVDYDLTEAEIISAVQDAFATGEWKDLKNNLDALNNQGCPLS